MRRKENLSGPLLAALLVACLSSAAASQGRHRRTHQLSFNLPPSTAQNEVAGYAKDGGKTIRANDGHNKKVLPVSTAEYNPSGWHAWLNGLTVTVGVNNVLDEEPPFVAAAFENGYDEATANIKGRVWYMALKKRF